MSEARGARRSGSLCGLTLTWLVAFAGHTSSQADASAVVAGAHFALHAPSLSPAGARRALAVADAAWDATTALTGLRPAGRGKPLPIHVHATTAAYRAVDRRLTGGRFRKNGAFAHWDTRSAHIEYAPPLAVPRQRAVDVPFQTLRLLSHEAAHLTCFALTTNYRDHPEWFSEGIATNVTEIVAKRTGLIESIEDDPYFGRKMIRVIELARRDRLPTVESILNDDLDGLPWLDAYAVRWAFFRVLRLRHGDALTRFCVAVSRMRRSPAFTRRCRERLERVVGKRPVAVALEESVRGFRPRWVELSRSLETAGDEWVQRAFPRVNAIAWRIEPVGADAYTLAGRVTFGGEGETPQMNVLLDRQRSGFVSVALQPNRVTVLERDATQRTWRRVITRQLERPVSEKAPFSVRCADRRLTVSFGGATLEATLPDRTLRGPWGLGVQAGDWGTWHGVALETR